MLILSVISVDKIEEFNNAVDEVTENPEHLKNLIMSLPEKGFDLLIKILLTLLAVLIGVFITKAIRRVLFHALDKAGIEKGTKRFVDSVVKYFCYILLFAFVLVRFGVAATSIVALIGSLGLTIGLALQGSLQNFAAGILILIIKPYVVGDYIKETSHGNEGTVEDIGLFYTHIHTVDGKDVFIPNSALSSNPVINFSKNGTRTLSMSVGISYSSDIKRAREIIFDLLKDYDINSNPTVFVENLSDSSIEIRFRAQVFSERYAELSVGIYERIKVAFDEAFIEIPYNQLDVHMK